MNEYILKLFEDEYEENNMYQEDDTGRVLDPEESKDICLST